MDKPVLIKSSKRGVLLETGYQNSNPSRADLVMPEAEVKFKVQQHFETGAAKGYSFHLNIALINQTRNPVIVPLEIRWGEPGYDFCRDYLYIGYDSGREWRMLATSSHEGITDIRVVVPSGRHLLCCSPKFDFHDYLRLLKKYSDNEKIEIIPVTQTPEEREIKCFRLGNPKGRRFVITTRAHGYETSGAYCICGLLKDIEAYPSKWKSYLEKLELYIFPMINPDAVAAGNCCVSTSGVNFGKQLGSAPAGDKDCAARLLTDYLLELKPRFYLDMHNNTGPHFVDSLRSNNKELLYEFLQFAPDLSRYQKTWETKKKKYGKTRPMVQCLKLHGTDYLVTEFPWYTRIPSEMEDTGVKFFRALFNTVSLL